MAEEKKKQDTENGGNVKSGETRQDGINESRHANFTLQSSGTKPYDLDSIMGKTTKSTKSPSDENNGKTGK